jgi:hypothetical protein
MEAVTGSWIAVIAGAVRQMRCFAAGGGDKAVEIGSWNAGRHVRQLRCFAAAGGEEKGAEIDLGARTAAAGGEEKGSEMIFAARAVLDPLPAWLLLVVVAFATYDRQEEVDYGVWEERNREFDLPGDL